MWILGPTHTEVAGACTAYQRVLSICQSDESAGLGTTQARRLRHPRRWCSATSAQPQFVGIDGGRHLNGHAPGHACACRTRDSAPDLVWLGPTCNVSDLPRNSALGLTLGIAIRVRMLLERDLAKASWRRVFCMWSFWALNASAAPLVAGYLGRGDCANARGVLTRVVQLGFALAAACAMIIGLPGARLPQLFTNDPCISNLVCLV